MASIIKVDTIQTAAGGTPGLADLGITGAGTVLQIVESSYTSATSVSSSTYVDTGMSGSITPKQASSTILITPFMNSFKINGAARTKVKLFRQIAGGGYSEVEEWNDFMGWSDNTVSSCTPVYKDSPTYTAGQQIDYKLQFALEAGTATIRINNASAGGGSARSNIVLTEIAG